MHIKIALRQKKNSNARQNLKIRIETLNSETLKSSKSVKKFTCWRENTDIEQNNIGQNPPPPSPIYKFQNIETKTNGHYSAASYASLDSIHMNTLRKSFLFFVFWFDLKVIFVMSILILQKNVVFFNLSIQYHSIKISTGVYIFL